MFSTSKDYASMSTHELLLELLQELDEVKRYSANTYANTDTEVKEVRDALLKVEQRLSRMDSQIDRIERFDRDINDMKNILKQIERKVN